MSSSVITQRGDGGETDLMFGQRVEKTHPRIVANGSLDELNATLGLVRVFAERYPTIAECISTLQSQLIPIMGEIATLPEDYKRYEAQFGILDDDAVASLTTEAKQIENALNKKFRDWAIPGASLNTCSAYLDMARTLCRRAERDLLVLEPEECPSVIVSYLNRLSDYLWLLARKVERE